MSRDQLTNSIRDSIKGTVENFISQKSEAAQKAEAERAKLQEFKQQLGEGSLALKGIEKAIRDLEHDPSADEKVRRQEAAFALVTFANELKLPVQLAKRSRRSSSGTRASRGSSGGGGGRMSQDEMERVADAVYDTLPPAGTTDDECLSKDEIADQAGVDRSALDSALLKLRRDGKAETNGKRGPSAGWRRAA